MKLKLALQSGLLLIACAASASADAGGATHLLNLKLAQVYLTYAEMSIQAKDWSTASHLVQTAIEYDPSSSDAYYEQGVIDEAAARGIAKAIPSYEKALAVDSWQKVSPDECRFRLSELLYRTRRYEQAVVHLQAMSAPDRADVQLLYARSLAAEGRNRAAVAVVQQAMQAFPDDFRFAELRVRIDPAYRRALAPDFVSGTDVWYFPASVLQELITDTVDRAEKLKLISRYDALYGASPAVFAQSLLAGAKVTRAEIDRFVQQGGLKEGRIAEQLYSALSDPADKRYLVSKAQSFTGTSSLDADRDGYPEQEAFYESGVLTRLVVDANQDGVPEFDVRFANRAPATAVINRAGEDYDVVYGQYPYVDRVEYAHEGIRTTYLMPPGRFRIPIFEGGANTAGTAAALAAASTTLPLPVRLLFPQLLPEAAPIDSKILFAAASSVQEINLATNEPYAMWNRSIDDLLRMASDWQSGAYRSEVVYRGNEKMVERRDIDGDGKFEVTATYEKGQLVKVSYDGNHDGKPEFWIDLKPYPVLSWDFNEDGVVDAMERKVSPTKTVLYLSSRLDGKFDLVVDEAAK